MPAAGAAARRRRPRPHRRRRRPTREARAAVHRRRQARARAPRRSEAERLGHERVAPGHLLLALAADPEAVELSSLDPARLRDEALRHLIDPPRALRPRPCRARRRPGRRCGSATASCRSATSAIRASTRRLLLAMLGLGRRQRGAAARARSRRGRRSRCARRRVSGADGVVRPLCGKPPRHGAGARRHVGRLAHGLPATTDRLILSAVLTEEVSSRAISRPTTTLQGPSIDRG